MKLSLQTAGDPWRILLAKTCDFTAGKEWFRGLGSGKVEGRSYFLGFFVFFLIFKFLAVLGLRCCTQAFSSCGERGLLFVAVRRLLIAVASLIVEHGLQVRGLQQLWLTGSRAQAQQLWHTSLVALRHVGPSRTRARTRVPCIGRRILNHCATGEALFLRFDDCFSPTQVLKGGQEAPTKPKGRPKKNSIPTSEEIEAEEKLNSQAQSKERWEPSQGREGLCDTQEPKGHGVPVEVAEPLGQPQELPAASSEPPPSS